MKVMLISFLALCFVGFAQAADTEKDLIAKAMEGDYQAERNLAFSYVQGWGHEGDDDYIPQNVIRGCALRKVILLTSPNADFGDYGNESIDCKKVAPTDNQQVWSIVSAFVQQINQNAN
ncbi:hypothetical protein EGE69_22330 [Salmonella enterica]|nr:hypothetical protein [Salmonella enterica]